MFFNFKEMPNITIFKSKLTILIKFIMGWKIIQYLPKQSRADLFFYIVLHFCIIHCLQLIFHKMYPQIKSLPSRISPPPILSRYRSIRSNQLPDISQRVSLLLYTLISHPCLPSINDSSVSSFFFAPLSRYDRFPRFKV